MGTSTAFARIFDLFLRKTHNLLPFTIDSAHRHSLLRTIGIDFAEEAGGARLGARSYRASGGGVLASRNNYLIRGVGACFANVAFHGHYPGGCHRIWQFHFLRDALTSRSQATILVN